MSLFGMKLFLTKNNNNNESTDDSNYLQNKIEPSDISISNKVREQFATQNVHFFV